MILRSLVSLLSISLALSSSSHHYPLLKWFKGAKRHVTAATISIRTPVTAPWEHDTNNSSRPDSLKLAASDAERNISGNYFSDDVSDSYENDQQVGRLLLERRTYSGMTAVSNSQPERPTPPTFNTGHFDISIQPSAAAYRQSQNLVKTSLSLDLGSLLRLVDLSLAAGYTFASAIVGTLRLLAPLVVARRCLAFLGEQAMDWYRGRYLRTTYRRMEHEYWRYFQVPATLRSIGRLITQTLMMWMIGRIMEWMLDLGDSPCLILSIDGISEPHLGELSETIGGCQFWCAALWLFAVMGVTHAGSAAMSVMGPLKLETCEYQAVLQRRRQRRRGRWIWRGRRPQLLRSAVLKPWQAILEWMQDPDRWLREIVARSMVAASVRELTPFHPDPLLFPATWHPIRTMQLFGVSQEMSNPRILQPLMRNILFQQACSDEWFRALMYERRVALGIFLMAVYFLSTIRVFWLAATSNLMSTLFMVPHLVAVIVSGWMNIYIYFDRKTARNAAREGNDQ